MKPVLILRFAGSEGPGYLAQFLEKEGLTWQLVRLDAADPLPNSVTAFSGLVLMGGPMSVNDNLVWINPVLDLIRQAVRLDIPLLGHCLGGQLISKALGAAVTQNPVKEIGWGEVSVMKNDVSTYWFGDIESFNAFHWHGETFALPVGAIPLMSSIYCQYQGYAIGKHLALQCHIEMTADMVQEWCELGAEEINQASDSPAVQSVHDIMENLPLHCYFLNKVANRIYGRWIKGLATA